MILSQSRQIPFRFPHSTLFSETQLFKSEAFIKIGFLIIVQQKFEFKLSIKYYLFNSQGKCSKG